MASDRFVRFVICYLKLTSVKSFSEEQENVNTKKKTLYDLNLFRDRSFLQDKDEMRELQEFLPPNYSTIRDNVCDGSVKERWQTFLSVY